MLGLPEPRTLDLVDVGSSIHLAFMDNGDAILDSSKVHLALCYQSCNQATT